jgi:hypothetical protein
MNTVREMPWPRIITESLAIVVSILLAFWIEAWWSKQQDRDAERALLSSIRDEFQVLQQQVPWRRKYNEGIRESIRQLLRASLVPGAELDDQLIDRHLAALWYNQELAPFALPELNSAVSSGDLSLISSRQIRRDVASWPERLDRVRNTMQRDLDFYSERQMPFLSANVSLPQILAVEDHIPGHPNEIYEDEFSIRIENPVSHKHLLSIQEFQNILIEREVLITDILYLGLWDGLDQQLNATLELISARIEN